MSPILHINRVMVRDDFKTLLPADNPYYVCKVFLLSFGVTVQDVRIETIRMHERSLQWTLNTLGLASYAKMGGVPYVLKARQLERHELIFGIGHSVERPPGMRLSPADEIIGFTTVFRSDGDYLLNSCTSRTTIAQYERELEGVIVRAIQDVAAIEGIADGESIRLIFHVFKKTGQREVRAIQNAIAKTPRFKIEFALLHVNDTHSMRMFDRTYRGRIDRSAEERDLSACIAPRRLVVEIGPRERLVNFIGPQQYRFRGLPAPIRFTLDRASTFTDLDYLVQQAYELSFMSWRSFNPGTEPVTILYSEFIARLNSRLKQVGAWNQDLVRTKLGRKLWFI